MKHIVLSALLLASCSKHAAKQPSTVNAAVVAKANLYKSLHTGWAHGAGCDSLGFSSLGKLAGGLADVDVRHAESQSEPGRWYRNADQDCFDLGKSASDISKDMIVMLLPQLYVSGDQANLQEMYAYGKAKGWVMGRGPVSRTIITPPIIYMLQVMINKVEPITLPREIPESRGGKAGYEKHLDVISWMTQAIVKGNMDITDYEQLRKYTEEQPRNALMAALYNKYKTGDQSKTIAILLDESLFPSDRLPTPRDRCEEYLWQRNEDIKDWGPCDKAGSHDGVDFLLAAWVAGQI